jgi:hypothetical protein
VIQVKDFGLLIVAFARAENVNEIIEVSLIAGIERIYIALDVSDENLEIQLQRKLIENKAYKLNEDKVGIQIKVIRRKSNVGCSANLLSGIDWAFEQEKNLMILEDDCIPSLDFFKFISDAHSYLLRDQRIWITGGTQIFPTIAGGKAVLSKYPITWGWATSKSKWNEIRSALIFEESNLNSFSNPEIGLLESVYWKAGARRSYAGIVDVWDIPLALCFLRNQKYAILPSNSLVFNQGDDKFALNTNVKSSGIRVPIGSYESINSTPKRSLELESAIRNSHYRIKRIHAITSFLHHLYDLAYLSLSKNKRYPLVNRWESALIKQK